MKQAVLESILHGDPVRHACSSVIWLVPRENALILFLHDRASLVVRSVGAKIAPLFMLGAPQAESANRLTTEHNGRQTAGLIIANDWRYHISCKLAFLM